MAEEEIKEVVEVEKNVKEKKIKWIVGVVIAIALLFLIIYKTQNPEFPFGTVIIISLALLLIGLSVFFGANIYKRIAAIRTQSGEEESEKLPKASTPDMIRQALEKFVLSRRNHIKEIMTTESYNIGKNTIYSYKIKLLYPDDSLKTNEVCVIVNANYLEEKDFSYTNADIPFAKLKRLINGISSSPLDDPDIEVVEEESPLTGIKRKITKTTPPKRKLKLKRAAVEEIG